MGLVPPRALMELAEVYTMGAQKYAAHNWTKGMKWSRIYDAVQRHLNQFWAGEDMDQESRLCHLAHAAWGLFTLLEFRRLHPELDDRYDYFQEAQQDYPELTQPFTFDNGYPISPRFELQGGNTGCDPLSPK